MTERFTATGFNSQIYEEASVWFVEMRAGDVDAAGRQRFDAWVRKSPEHLRAYLEISEIWDDAPLVDEAQSVAADELIAKARAGAEVVPFGGPSVNTPAPGASRQTSLPRFRARGRWAAAAAVGAIACGLAAFLGYRHFREPEYSTGIGEQRVLTLADGTRVELNSRTRLTIRFTDERRDVELNEGQAMFTVAKDARRPFVVLSRNLTVRAVGTAFDVNQQGTNTTVTVVDGRVAVGTPGSASPAPVMVDAGEQVTAPVQVHKPLRAARVNVSAATAWTHGELVFEGSRLADVIEEFNRHNERQIVLADPALQDLEISGVYASTDPDLFIRFMRAQPHVRVEETPGSVVITSSL
jgi:transmembrane sensor